MENNNQSGTSEKLYRWVDASLKLCGDNKPAGEEKQRISILYKGQPSIIILLDGRWHWYEEVGDTKTRQGRGGYYKIHKDSWAAIEWLEELPPSIQDKDAEIEKLTKLVSELSMERDKLRSQIRFTI